MSRWNGGTLRGVHIRWAANCRIFNASSRKATQLRQGTSHPFQWRCDVKLARRAPSKYANPEFGFPDERSLLKPHCFQITRRLPPLSQTCVGPDAGWCLPYFLLLLRKLSRIRYLACTSGLTAESRQKTAQSDWYSVECQPDHRCGL